MDKEKDPAFLLYSKDWLEGTAEMKKNEKGIYMDLLCHQHQKGGIPADIERIALMVGMSVEEFSIPWEAIIKYKFYKIGDRLVNRKLSKVVTERSTKSHTNRLTGKFASLIRTASHLPPIILESIKKEFKLTDFDQFPTEQGIIRLTEWFHSRSGSIENANEDLLQDQDLNNKEEKVKKFNTFPKNTDFNGLPEIKAGSVVEMVKIMQKVDIDLAQVQSMWEVFKIQNLTGKKWYGDDDDVYSHYINWVKDKKFTDGKSNQQGGSTSNTKLGTSGQRLQTGKDFIRGNKSS